MRKYLTISEYLNSSSIKLPEKQNTEFEFCIKDRIYRTSVKESYEDMITYAKPEDEENSQISKKDIDLSDVIIYDNLDVIDSQELAYVYNCPVCLSTTISSEANLDFCPSCENAKFPLELIALINTEQMEELAVDEDNSLILFKDGKIVFKDIK